MYFFLFIVGILSGVIITLIVFSCLSIHKAGTGFWFETGNGDYKCSDCGLLNNNKTSYCPHCGLKKVTIND